MKAHALAGLAAALITAGCGGGGSGGPGGPVTAPTPTGQTQPPAVNVNSQGTVFNGQSLDVLWNGDVSFNEQSGTNTIGFPGLAQNGSQVSGQINFYGPDGGGGPFRGVVSGTTLAFNFSIGNMDQGCGNTADALPMSQPRRSLRRSADTVAMARRTRTDDSQ